MVRVLHVVQRGAHGPTLAALFGTGLHVQQTLRAQRRVLRRIEVVRARGLTVRHGCRHKTLQGLRRRPCQTGLGVEERQLVLDVDFTVVVVAAGRLVQHLTRLNFTVPAEVRHLARPLSKGAHIRLLAEGTVVLVAWLSTCAEVHPNQLSKVIAGIKRARHPIDLRIVLGRTAHRPRGPEQRVVKPATTHQIRGKRRVCAHHQRRQSVIGQVVALTELLVETRPQRGVKHPAKIPIAQSLVQVDLVVVLTVVVHLVFVAVVVVLGATVEQICHANRVFAVVVLSAALHPIEDVLVRGFRIGNNLGNAVPSLVGSLVTQGGGEGQTTCLPTLGNTAVQGAQVARSPIHPSIRRDARGPAFKGPAILEHPGVPGEGATLGSKRTSSEHRTNAGLGERPKRVHRHRGPEGGGTVGARAHATLDLEACHAASEVGKIHPKDALRLGVVQGHPIDGDVDSALVHTANAERGVTNAVTGIRGDHCRRCQPQQKRHVLRSVLLLDVFDFKVGDRKGILVAGLHGRHGGGRHVEGVHVELGLQNRSHEEHRERQQRGWTREVNRGLCHRVLYCMTQEPHKASMTRAASRSLPSQHNLGRFGGYHLSLSAPLRRRKCSVPSPTATCPLLKPRPKNNKPPCTPQVQLRVCSCARCPRVTSIWTLKKRPTVHW